ncbi:mitochondrial import inner membrane translocase subunit TIM23-2 [Arachis duranensis]|uniref:Mitochondrial import inner membrane translocase subunit TIM23-2 n=1 Tax=Arachis duranensis TaxID=130453 RepID=A0A6P4BHB7_ARADU|nr:mitochondrial import inner membrane translocase subunit TIM23-2 [Arachis duranensis]
MDNSLNNNDKKSQNTRFYDPYRDLKVPIKNLYNLPTSPDNLFPELANRTYRPWNEKLTYYTGIACLTGAVGGGITGTLEGIRAAERGDSFKIRVNRVLNSGIQRGRRLGNSLGSLGLIFSVTESTIQYFTDRDDMVNSAAAGLATGALFKAAAGPRSAVIAGVLGGIAAAATVAGKQALRRYVPI